MFNKSIPLDFLNFFTKFLRNTVVYELVLERELAPHAKKPEFLHFLNCTFILKVIHILHYPLYLCYIFVTGKNKI